MLLRDRLIILMQERELHRFARQRVVSALGILEAALGPLDLSELSPPELAERVRVPGDSAPYIVIGEWMDGTYDVIREQGSFSSDMLVGWRPGQSLTAFRHELDAEEVEVEPAPEVRVADNVHPLPRPKRKVLR